MSEEKSKLITIVEMVSNVCQGCTKAWKKYLKIEKKYGCAPWIYKEEFNKAEEITDDASDAIKYAGKIIQTMCEIIDIMPENEELKNKCMECKEALNIYIEIYSKAEDTLDETLETLVLDELDKAKDKVIKTATVLINKLNELGTINELIVQRMKNLLGERNIINFLSITFPICDSKAEEKKDSYSKKEKLKYTTIVKPITPKSIDQRYNLQSGIDNFNIDYLVGKLIPFTSISTSDPKSISTAMQALSNLKKKSLSRDFVIERILPLLGDNNSNIINGKRQNNIINGKQQKILDLFYSIFDKVGLTILKSVTPCSIKQIEKFIEFSNSIITTKDISITTNFPLNIHDIAILTNPSNAGIFAKPTIVKCYIRLLRLNFTDATFPTIINVLNNILNYIKTSNLKNTNPELFNEIKNIFLDDINIEIVNKLVNNKNDFIKNDAKKLINLRDKIIGIKIQKTAMCEVSQSSLVCNINNQQNQPRSCLNTNATNNTIYQLHPQPTKQQLANIGKTTNMQKQQEQNLLCGFEGLLEGDLISLFSEVTDKIDETNKTTDVNNIKQPLQGF